MFNNDAEFGLEFLKVYWDNVERLNSSPLKVPNAMSAQTALRVTRSGHGVAQRTRVKGSVTSDAEIKTRDHPLGKKGEQFGRDKFNRQYKNNRLSPSMGRIVNQLGPHGFELQHPTAHDVKCSEIWLNAENKR